MLWIGVIAGALVCFGAKATGYAAPQSWLDSPRVVRTAALVTVSLLAALVAVQAVGDGARLSPDARLAGLAVAAVALVFRAPFVVVVILAAAVTAGLRTLG